MSLTSAFQKQKQQNEDDKKMADGYDRILRALQDQKKTHLEYAASVARRQKDYQSAESDYQSYRQFYNDKKRGVGEKKIYDGDKFSMTSWLFGEREFSKPDERNYTVSKSKYINPEMITEDEKQIVRSLGNMFGERLNEALDLIYEKVPAHLSTKAQENIFAISKAWGNSDLLNKEYTEIAVASAAIKFTGDVSFIDAQIKKVNTMMKSKDPLKPKTNFFKRIFG